MLLESMKLEDNEKIAEPSQHLESKGNENPLRDEAVEDRLATIDHTTGSRASESQSEEQNTIQEHDRRIIEPTPSTTSPITIPSSSSRPIQTPSITSPSNNDSQPSASSSPSRIWQNDEETNHCNLCRHDFSFLVRRHHCRWCGKLFCSSCSEKRVKLKSGSESLHRVCDVCYTFLVKKEDDDEEDQEASVDLTSSLTYCPVCNKRLSIDEREVERHLKDCLKDDGNLKVGNRYITDVVKPVASSSSDPSAFTTVLGQEVILC